jgi:hypothetical protein
VNVSCGVVIISQAQAEGQKQGRQEEAIWGRPEQFRQEEEEKEEEESETSGSNIEEGKPRGQQLRFLPLPCRL